MEGRILNMKKCAAVVLSPLLLLSFLLIISCKKAEKTVEPPKSASQVATQANTGEELFNMHCIMCHPEGSKIQNVQEPADIVKVMRNPKGGMPQFKEKAIPDKEANVIASFIFLSILSQK